MTDFEELVLKMRTAQIGYFQSRDKDTLREAKKLEKQVDKYLADNAPKKPENDPRQTSLF